MANRPEPAPIPTEDDKLDALADYYDTHDTSLEMEEGEWVEPQPMKTTSLRLPANIVDALKARARSRGMRYTAFVREILEQAMSDVNPARVEELRRIDERLSRPEAATIINTGDPKRPSTTVVDRWRSDYLRSMTIKPEKTILAVVGGVTSTNRILDALSSIVVDRRVDILFTVEQPISISADPHDLLARLGVKVLTWEQVKTTEYDLVIAAHPSAYLATFEAPRVILAHRLHSKWFENLTTNPGESSTGSLEELFFADSKQPTVIGLASEEQYGEIEKSYPSVATQAVVVGDPRFDRIVAHLRYREHFRRTLGVGDRRLVLVSSTWGPHSLLALYPNLAADLVAQLPSDRYQVAVLMHPNVWKSHGEWQVRGWLRELIRDGLLVVQPDDGWQAALIASDIVIGDHGSVSQYAEFLERPLFIPSPGVSTRDAIEIDTEKDLLSQLEAGVGSSQDVGALTPIDKLSNERAKHATTFFDTVYKILSIRSVEHIPSVAPVPTPQLESRPQ